MGVIHPPIPTHITPLFKLTTPEKSFTRPNPKQSSSRHSSSPTHCLPVRHSPDAATNTAFVVALVRYSDSVDKAEELMETIREKGLIGWKSGEAQRGRRERKGIEREGSQHATEGLCILGFM
eukprot:936414-Amorphochlora_amoeboformis.AAC.1